MNQRTQFVFGVMCALLCGICMPSSAFGQTLPNGKGKAEFVRVCTACHNADRTTRLRKTPEGWRKEVDRMIDRGADGSKTDIDNIVHYLSTNFGLDKAGPAATPQSKAPSTK